MSDVLSENNICISKEQRKQLEELHKLREKLGLSNEKGARYTLKHPSDRSIQRDFEDKNHRPHKPPFYFDRF